MNIKFLNIICKNLIYLDKNNLKVQLILFMKIFNKKYDYKKF